LIVWPTESPVVEATLKLVAPTGTRASVIATFEKPEWLGEADVLPIEITSRVLVPVAINRDADPEARSRPEPRSTTPLATILS
jgi:hypothetical protein